MENNKIAVFGCKANTRFLIEELRKFTQVDFLVTISPQVAEKNQVADFMDLSSWAEKTGTKVYVSRSYSLKDILDQQAIGEMRIDLAFVNGWQRLLPGEVLDTFSIGAFGMHGSAMNLPKGRGRSPMNWSILEGRRYFYTNIFKYDPGVDSGGVLDTLKFQILDTDTAETMHYKNSLAMVSLIRLNWNRLKTGKFNLIPQKAHIKPTYYPKRNPRHNQIDFSEDILGIERLIRAVAPPFGGAYAYLDNGEKIIINRATIFDINDFYFQGMDEGVVVMVWPTGKFLVKCLGGLLLVHDYKSVSEVHQGHMFIQLAEDPIEGFARNRFGFFDMESDE